ncbi:MAG: carbohydrate ABC transporter permease, partial [Gemmobacter sp.]
MTGALLRYLALGALALFVTLPFAQTVMLSFVSTLPREGLAEGTLSLVNYRNILASPALMASLVNSAVYVVLNVALCLVAGLPAAYALSRYRFVGDRHFLF